MNSILISVSLPVGRNLFMTFTGSARLQELSNKPWLPAALISWDIALFEYLLQVPGNRIGIITTINTGHWYA